MAMAEVAMVWAISFLGVLAVAAAVAAAAVLLAFVFVLAGVVDVDAGVVVVVAALLAGVEGASAGIEDTSSISRCTNLLNSLNISTTLFSIGTDPPNSK